VTNWFETPLGRRVLQEETLLAREALEDVFGFDLLQIGHWGQARGMLGAVRTQHALVVASAPGEGIAVHAQLEALPFAADSVDAVLLPHTLELVDDPYAVLREAERILRPEGALLICGFNPWSGWGLRRLLARSLDRPVFPPDIQRMLSEMRLKDWVALLGMDVQKVSGYLGLVPWAGPVAAQAYRPRPAVMCGAYLLKARKRVQTLTLLKPKWKTRPRVLVTAAEPSRRMHG
jgi:SAM-dependent methyltransferase